MFSSSEDFFRDLYKGLDAVPIAVAVLMGDELVVDFINQYNLKLWQRSKEEVVGKPLSQIFSESAEYLKEVHLQVYRTSSRRTLFELPLEIFEDGQRVMKWFNTVIDPLRNDKGETVGLMASTLDVTDQVIARKNIEISQNQLSNLANAMPQVVWIAQDDGTVVYYNDRVTEYAGASQNRDGSWSWEALLHADDRQGTVQAWSKAVAEGSIYQKEHRLKMKNGVFRWHLSRALPQRDESGTIVAWYGTATDIHENKIAAESIQKSEHYFRRLINTVPTIIWLTAPDGSCTYLNQNWFDFTGQSEEEAIGLGWLDATHPEDKDNAARIFLEANAQRKPFSILYRIREKNGKYRWAIDSGRPRYGENGQFEGFIGTVLDIHEQRLAEQAALESNERFENLVKEAPVGIILLTGPEMIVEIANRSFCRLIDQLPVDLIGKPLFHIIPEGREMYLPVLINVLQTGTPDFLYDSPYSVSRDGKLVSGFLNIICQPYRDDEGELVGVLALVQDVTDSVRSKKALQQSEAKFRSVISDAPVAIGLFVGRDLVIQDPNQAFINVVGKGWDVVGKPLREAMPELITEGQPYLKILDDVFTTGKMYRTSGSLVKIVQNEVLTHRYYNFTYSPLLNSEGQVWAILDIAMDVTEQVEALQKLQESEERFRILAETLPQLIWTTDNKGQLEYTSNRWKEFTGIEQTSMETWVDVVHPDDLKAAMENWDKCIDTCSTFQMDVRLLNKAGEYRWHFSHGEPIKNKDGDVVKWIGAFTDIHEQKSLAQNLEKLVAERTLELSAANRDLHRSNDDLQQFAHVASHDLREPIRKIKVFASRLEDDPAIQISAQGKSYLNKINSAGDRMINMIDGVLHYSKTNSNEQEISLIDLNVLISSIQLDLEIVVAESEAEIEVEKLPVIEGAFELLYQMFYNLINNSLKFRKPGVAPLISISSEYFEMHGQGFTKIIVSDNGIGFDQKDADAIFQTFFRLHSKSQYEGTGLGLSLCKKIVERHGGTIKAFGKKQEGAVFTIYLPVKQMKEVL